MIFIPFIATVEPPIDANATNATLWGIVGLMSIAVLGLSLVVLGRKVFGRQPPLDEHLRDKHKKIFGEIEHAKNAVRKELRAELAVERERIGLVEERYAELQLDRQRKWESLTHDLGEVRESVAFIRGKFEAKENES